MHLIVGLGNLGNEHINNRHNTGFMVMDALAKSAKVDFKPGKGHYWIAKAHIGNSEFTIMKPTTYMNNSGIAIQEFRNQCELPLENMLIVCDDFELPLGAIRIRRSGSDGGHNGLASIIYHLQTEEFPRLRCGTASQFMPTSKSNMREFVLSDFEKPEIPTASSMIQRAREACLIFITDGIDKAMNKFNYVPNEEIN